MVLHRAGIEHYNVIDVVNSVMKNARIRQPVQKFISVTGDCDGKQTSVNVSSTSWQDIQIPFGMDIDEIENSINEKMPGATVIMAVATLDAGAGWSKKSVLVTIIGIIVGIVGSAIGFYGIAKGAGGFS